MEIVGTHNEQRLPHNRQDCLEFRYVASRSSSSSSFAAIDCDERDDNARFCKLCYCYVCDGPASECEDWFEGRRGVIGRANDDGCAGKKGEEGEEEQDDCGGGGGGGDDDDVIATTTTTTKGRSLLPHHNHCQATDRGTRMRLWKNMRAAIKGGRDPSMVSSTRDETIDAAS